MFPSWTQTCVASPGQQTGKSGQAEDMQLASNESQIKIFD